MSLCYGLCARPEALSRVAPRFFAEVRATHVPCRRLRTAGRACDWTDSPAFPQFELHDRALKGSPYEREHFVPKPCACSGRGLFTGVMGEIINWSIQGCKNMETIESKVTSQGQVSVPAPVRQKLGLAPGSRIEWREKGEEVVVRKASKYSSRDIHKAVFATPQDPVDVAGMDAGIRSRIRREHAGR